MVERNGKSSLGDNQNEKEELGMRAILERNGKSSLGEKNKKKESGVNVKNWGCGPCRRGTGFLLSVRIKKKKVHLVHEHPPRQVFDTLELVIDEELRGHPHLTRR